MAIILRNQPQVARTGISYPTTGGSVYLNPNEFFFYSNNPEKIQTKDLADSGKFLNRVSVGGIGQVYTWHANGCGRTIKSCILIYNPNSYEVKVNVTHYGLTNTSNTGLPDAAAWKSYYNGGSTSITVPANGYGNLFLRNIGSNYNFGVVARVNIVNSRTSAPATVTMFDLAYESKSDSATAFATAESMSTMRRRGKGVGFYATVNFPTISPTNTSGIGFKIATSTDFFSGNDCSYITDPSNEASGLLEGAYGQQFYVTMSICNTTGVTRKFRIFIGSNGGNCFPFVNLGDEIVCYTTCNRERKNFYTDVIETGSIAPGKTESVSFSSVVTAMAATPYVIGARTI